MTAPTVAAQQCGLDVAREAAARLRQSGLYKDAQLADRLEAATPPDVAGLIERLEADVAEQRSHGEPINGSLVLEAATALRLSAGGGWRDAGSVPEDGSVILAYRPDAGVFTAHYVEEDAHLSSLANPPEGDCYWFTTNGDDLTGDMFTHWQPLPVPPTAPAEGA